MNRPIIEELEQRNLPPIAPSWLQTTMIYITIFVWSVVAINL